MNEDTMNLEDSRNRRARTAAHAAIGDLSINPTGTVQYHSTGRLAVIGGEAAQWFAASIEPPLQAQIILTEGDEEPGRPTVPVGNRSLCVDGHLGDFRIELGEAGKPNHEIIRVDMVLDLSERPLIDRELPPPGYWRSGTEPQDLDVALLTVGDMIGTFEKPRYFDYDPDICAHGRSGQLGCQRCLQACPAEAIVSLGDRIEVDPNLCQGGGICASVCPSGAMRYAYPGPADTLGRVRLLLKHYQAAGGSDPVILFAAESDAAGLASLPGNLLLVVVEELASVGIEVWLSALAWGAKGVLLADGGSVPPRVGLALDRQFDTASTLLGGLGYPADALQRVDCTDLARTRATGMPDIAAAGFDALDDKRRQLSFALDHLTAEGDARDSTITLPPGSLFGTIKVNTDDCTLCMSCTSVCPAGALNAGGDTPRLEFHESNCVQCGICSNACPEKAITLESRYIVDPALRRKPVTLHEEPPFCCIECGKPFATHKTIDNILTKLTDHPMFQNERATRRLKMCEDCRVVDAVQDAEAMGAGIDPALSSPGRRN